MSISENINRNWNIDKNFINKKYKTLYSRYDFSKIVAYIEGFSDAKLWAKTELDNVIYVGDNKKLKFMKIEFFEDEIIEKNDSPKQRVDKNGGKDYIFNEYIRKGKRKRKQKTLKNSWKDRIAKKKMCRKDCRFKEKFDRHFHEEYFQSTFGYSYGRIYKRDQIYDVDYDFYDFFDCEIYNYDFYDHKSHGYYYLTKNY